MNDVYFPIAKTKDGYLDKRSRRKIAKLSPDLQAKIDQLEPYGDNILVALNALCSMDKHQNLLDAIPSIQDTEWTAYGLRDFKRLEFGFRKPDPKEHGEIEILRFPADSPIDAVHLKLQCHVIFVVEPIVGKPVAETLTNMARTVEGIISRFETLCYGA